MITDPSERLHIDVPTLEPDPVLLSQLAARAAASSSAGLGPRRAGARVLLAAASVAAVAVMAWGVAQIPGGGSTPPHPIQSPGRDQHSPTSPDSRGRGGTVTPSSRAPEEPDADAPTSPASDSSPGTGPGSTDGSGPGQGRGDGGKRAPGSAATTPGSSSDGGQGRSGDNNPGKHNGQQKPHQNSRPTRGSNPGQHTGQEKKIKADP